MTTVALGEIQRAGQDGITTPDSVLTIEMQDDRLPLGEHRFQLTVADNSGNQSVAAIVSVFILDQQAPTAVLRVLGANGQPINRIPFGDTFTLDGTLSTDQGGGVIDRFVWRLLGPNDL